MIWLLFSWNHSIIAIIQVQHELKFLVVAWVGCWKTWCQSNKQKLLENLMFSSLGLNMEVAEQQLVINPCLSIHLCWIRLKSQLKTPGLQQIQAHHQVIKITSSTYSTLLSGQDLLASDFLVQTHYSQWARINNRTSVFNLIYSITNYILQNSCVIPRFRCCFNRNWTIEIERAELSY